ncbi:hypothetical protein GCM10010243_55290 [Streptomyces matensis]|nr:hypothetical protein GCM10010243_55290 [Streptomyces matensis]
MAAAERGAPEDTVPGRSAPRNTGAGADDVAAAEPGAPEDTVPGRGAPGNTAAGADDLATAPTVAHPVPPRPDRSRLWPDRVPPPPPAPPRPPGSREPEGGDEDARGAGGR